VAIRYSQHTKVAHALVEATKTANAPPPSLISDIVRHPAFLAPLAMMGVGAAVGGAQSLVTRLADAKKKNDTFRGMLQLNPTLRDQDQTTVKRVFSSLHAANPHFMNDPMVAGALVHSTIEAQSAYGMDQPMVALAKQVSELSQGRASIVSSLEKERKMRSSWGEAAQRAVQGGFEAVKDIQAEQKAQPLAALRREKEKFEDQVNKFQRERAVEAQRAAVDRATREIEQLENRRQRALQMLGNVPSSPPSAPPATPAQQSLLGRIRSVFRTNP